MKKIYYLLLLSVLFVVSCSKEELQPIGFDDIPNVNDLTYNDKVVNHFMDIAVNSSDGKYYELLIFKGDINIYLHDGMSQSDENTLRTFVNEIDSTIKNDNIRFNFVTDTINANVFVMSGTQQQYNDYWGYTNSNNFIGATRKFRDINDCSGLEKSSMWYTQGQATMKHEFLHGIGLYHTEVSGNIMNHYIQIGSDELSNMDKDVLYLLYHPDLISDSYDCSDADNLLTTEEVDEIKNKLYHLLETR